MKPFLFVKYPLEQRFILLRTYLCHRHLLLKFLYGLRSHLISKKITLATTKYANLRSYLFPYSWNVVNDFLPWFPANLLGIIRFNRTESDSPSWSSPRVEPNAEGILYFWNLYFTEFSASDWLKFTLSNQIEMPSTYLGYDWFVVIHFYFM